MNVLENIIFQNLSSLGNISACTPPILNIWVVLGLDLRLWLGVVLRVE